MEIPKGYSLSNCPFCGSDQLRMYPFKAGLDVDYKVQCYCLGAAEGRTPEEAIGCWNDRAPKAPTPPQPIFDEAKERELFAEFSRRIVAHDAENFPIRWCDCVPDEAIEDHLNTWLACAQSRAKAGEDE